MHEQRSHCVANTDDRIEQAILGLLLNDQTTHIWAVEELVREIGDRLTTIDALRRLTAAGIVHHVASEYIIITRSARRVIELWEEP